MEAKLSYSCPDSEAVSGLAWNCFLEESLVGDEPESFIVSEEEW